MWKKILILCLALLGTAGAGYAFYSSNMEAVGVGYRVGGAVTGRIQTLPAGISGGRSVGFQKGDKILMGTGNPMGGDLAWLLIKERSYSDYAANGCVASMDQICQNTPINAWFSMTTTPIGKTNAGFTTSDFVNNYHANFASANYADSNIYPIVQSLSSNILSNSQDQKILTYRDLTQFHAEYTKALTLTASTGLCIAEEIFGAMNRNAQLGKSIFVHALQETNDEMNLFNDTIPYSDTTFSEDYFSSTFYYTNNTPLMYTNIRSDYQGGIALSGKNIGLGSSKVNLAIRPSAYLDLSQAVFGISTGLSNGSIAKIEEPDIQGYSALHQAADQYDAMKLRIEDSKLNIKFKDILNQKDVSITQAAENSKIKISADANAGSDSHGIYTVSVLIFKDDRFTYYRPLEAAKGDGTYEFNLAGLPIGKYKIGIVNESYNDGDNAPAACTAITAVKSLEIVEPLSTITVTPKNDLEVKKNVNKNDPVASITSSVGVKPITYTVISDTSESGHADDYQLFSISGSNVVVKGPDGLHAGDYYFKVNAVDANGDPTGGVESSTVHIIVGKTDLTIEFNDPKDTKKTIKEAQTKWSELATVKPNPVGKIVYTIVGGDIGLIDLDKDTGEITYKGNGVFGKVKIRATVDDDPDSEYDDYNEAYTEKDILIVREVNGIVIPDDASTDKNVPTFSTDQANIKTGGTIGKIEGRDGTPDDIGSGNDKVTYSYAIKSGDNASYFEVDSQTGVIKSKVNLAVGSYKFKITVSDKWTNKDVEVTVNVGVAKAEELKFYENSTSNTVINQKTVNFTDTNVSVYATVKGSTNTNPVKYKIKDGSSTVITVNENTGAVTIKGIGTVTIVAEKKGASGQADASAELVFTVKASEQEFIYTTDSTLSTERPKTGEKYNTLKETYAPNKTFHVYTTGNPTGSTVTYKLKDGCPTDVISVDADGTIHILNASLPTQIGKVIVEATSHDPSGNYDDKTIELPIDIEKGERKVEFKENPINVVSGSGSVNPEILVDGTLDTSGTAVIEVD
ncbi:MAG: cadherin repeat domain-containing protein, partial [Lachnospiraceae bacterium]|nr:cadherin repeat domain-containing protein [Lachnospiraceae bacterium]